MTAQEKIQKVTEISQSKGWSISVDDKNKSNIQFDFQRYTNYGQDFNFSAEMKCEDIDTLIADMEQYFEGFDTDYEAYLWIGNDGHGKNGAPYHIKDIVSDMEDVYGTTSYPIGLYTICRGSRDNQTCHRTLPV